MKQTLAALLFLIPVFAGATEHRATTRTAVAWQPGTHVVVENLAGEVSLHSHPGNELVFEVTVVADARGMEAAVALAERVTLKQEGMSFWMDYPIEDHDHFIYRTRSGNSNTTSTYRGERVQVSSRGRGPVVHADMRILVPQGADLTLYLAVGRVEADGVRADLSIRTGAGRIEARGTHGALRVNTGSGSVHIESHQGQVEGRTGSGSIRVEKIASESVSLRTGSGSIRIGELTGTSELNVSTGSGSIRTEGDLGGLRQLNMSTGSGSITIDSRGVPDMRLEARAGSGSVSVEVPGMREVRTQRNHVDAVMGEGSGNARLTTGSGSIRFRAGH